MQFISSIEVIYSDEPSGAPAERVRELTSQNDDINYQFGGKYVWLVPVYTSDRGAAVTGFEIAIQKDGDQSLNDLAKGAGGDYRYLLPIEDVTQAAKVTEVALLRLDSEMTDRPGEWSGNTIDINKGRGKTYLYLLWKTA